MKVFILSTYDENGAEDIRATLDVNNLPQILEEWSNPPYRNKSYEKKELQKALEEFKKTGEVGHYDLSEGWGGILFDIVELQ